MELLKQITKTGYRYTDRKLILKVEQTSINKQGIPIYHIYPINFLFRGVEATGLRNYIDGGFWGVTTFYINGCITELINHLYDQHPAINQFTIYDEKHLKEFELIERG